MVILCSRFKNVEIRLVLHIFFQKLIFFLVTGCDKVRPEQNSNLTN